MTHFPFQMTEILDQGDVSDDSARKTAQGNQRKTKLWINLLTMDKTCFCGYKNVLQNDKMH